MNPSNQINAEACLEKLNALNQQAQLDFVPNEDKKVLTINSSFATQSHVESNNFKLPDKTVLFYLNEELYKDKRFTDSTNYLDKTILIIGTGALKRTSILYNLKKMKFKNTVCLIRQRNWAENFFDHIIEAEHEDDSKREETLDSIRKFMHENSLKFDAVFTYDDMCVVLTAFIAINLNLPSVPYEIAKKIKNKYEFRKLTASLDISCPKFCLIKSHERLTRMKQINKEENDAERMNDEFFKELNDFKWPIVLKNPLGLGKDFVCKCKNLKEMAQRIQESIDFSQEMDLMIEEFLEGHEIDLDVLVQNNKVVFVGISDNFEPEEPYFFETGGVTPSIELTDNEKRYIESIAEDWITRLNIGNACLHFEAICRPQSIYKKSFEQINKNDFLMPIEINLRMAGAEIWSMNNMAYGVNLFLDQIDISLGFKLDQEFLKKTQLRPQFQCISNRYHPAKNVFLEQVEIDFAAIQRSQNVFDLTIFRILNEKLVLQDYLGWLTVKSVIGSSLKEILEQLNQVKCYVSIHLKDD